MIKEKEAKGTEEISVVIPLYKSADILPSLLDRLENVLTEITEDYEIVLVNDCSPDGTWDRLKKEVTIRPHLVALNLARNYGQHNALLAGIRKASYPLCVTMDDDLQNPPEEIPKLIEALTHDTDVVYGAPLREKRSITRKLAARVTKFILSRSMNVSVAEQVSAFRLFRTRLRDVFETYRGPFINIDVLLTWATSRFIAIKVKHDERPSGTSTYTIGPLVTLAINLVTGFSVLPLQIISLLGIAMAFFGVIVFLYVVGLYFIYGQPPPGFPFLASIIAIFSGAQLFSLGVIGEYLWRMYYRVMDQPSYVIRECFESQEVVGQDND